MLLLTAGLNPDLILDGHGKTMFQVAFEARDLSLMGRSALKATRPLRATAFIRVIGV